MIVTSALGGGYDAYARLMSRHLGHHITGPTSPVIWSNSRSEGLRHDRWSERLCQPVDVGHRDAMLLGEVRRR
jgi:hypothetical protein